MRKANFDKVMWRSIHGIAKVFFYHDDPEEGIIAREEGGWVLLQVQPDRLADKMAKKQFIGIAKIAYMHAYDYVKNQTIAQLEVTYEGF